MSSQKDAPVIRIVKKKHGHGGHHGGSWKVAYADFVTAMMAFFLVMWIISMDQETREEIQNYFNDPFSVSNNAAGIAKLTTGGRNPIARGINGLMSDRGWKRTGARGNKDIPGRGNQKLTFLKVQEQLEEEIARRPDLSKLAPYVKVSVTEDGLMIELIEEKDSLFFESGSAVPPPAARKLLALIARHLGRLPHPIVIEGHTDANPYRGRTGYSNWELSVDRANAARRIMSESGLRPGQASEVSGFADTRLRDPEHPTSGANRRVTILVNFDGVQKPSDAPAGIQPDIVPQDQPFVISIRG
jgi:chemotaxis protein MotB